MKSVLTSGIVLVLTGALLLSGCTSAADSSTPGESFEAAGSSAVTSVFSSNLSTTQKGNDAMISTESSLTAASSVLSPTTTAPKAEMYRIRSLTYPSSAVQTLEQRNLTAESFVQRTTGSGYDGQTHRAGTNLVVSPYYTATADNLAVPVYATPVYVATGNKGALHSFASIDVEFADHARVAIQLDVSSRIACSSVQVFSANGTTAAVHNNRITMNVTAHGVYTLVLNDSQDTAFTLFVREYADEEAEIAAYRRQYGEDKVLVYEPGLHPIDYLLLMKNDMVLYLKAGAILLPKHTFDIRSDIQASTLSEGTASYCNALGLNRFPVVNGFQSSNLRIAGRGTVDMTGMDWHERRGIVFSLCNNVTIEGVILVNPAEWALITYRCSNVRISQCAVLGYRTNSDAFAICNSVDVQVTDCFARTGDDMFEVKTLGGPSDAVSRNITYSRCQAWGSKARCFGIIGEIERDVSDVLFEDSTVIWRDAIWDNDRIGSLVVIREVGQGIVQDITFRNIQIHQDKGRAINCVVYTPGLAGSRMNGILFENIRYTAGMPSQCKLNSGSGNQMKVTLKNVTANGEKVTSGNLHELFLQDQNGLIAVE